MNINKSSQQADLPAYQRIVEGDLYLNPKKCARRDNDFVSMLRTFFQYKKLVAETIWELKKDQKVLQVGVVNGSEMDEVAMAVGAYGRYDIVDVNPAQADRVTEKYWKLYHNMKVYKKNVIDVEDSTEYDAVICFMVLSEVPSQTKSQIINKALRMVKVGGKVIFTDWHNPEEYHPLRYIVRMYNRLYHPFVERLWDRNISVYAKPEYRNKFEWKKDTYFGRMFQKTVAIKKEEFDINS